MIKLVVEQSNTGKVEEYYYHKKWEYIAQYALAAFNIGVMIVCIFSKDYLLALYCLAMSFFCASKGRELERENLIIEFVAELSTTTKDKDEKGGEE